MLRRYNWSHCALRDFWLTLWRDKARNGIVLRRVCCGHNLWRDIRVSLLPIILWSILSIISRHSPGVFTRLCIDIHIWLILLIHHLLMILFVMQVWLILLTVGKLLCLLLSIVLLLVWWLVICLFRGMRVMSSKLIWRKSWFSIVGWTSVGGSV